MTSKKKKNTAAAAAARGGKESKAAARKRRHDEKTAKEKHRMRNHRKFDPKMWAHLPPLPHGLNAKLEIPKMKTKHQVYLEFAENTEKKKKLETTVTTERNAPPGFEFVPIGDPEMTTMCKEISREQGAMIFIVSSKNENALAVYDHVDRIGFHFRETIVDQAREHIGQSAGQRQPGWNVEKIPESQDEINRQTDAAIRDLFPRIPNTDRAQIIQHGFQKGKLFNGKEMIGLQPGIPLARRVQLATLAHIRHTHTRYDLLLKETTWENARRAVEPVCLDFILKWRGDEETGRDQMDEILREVVVITDSEDEDDEDDDDDNEDDENSSEEDGEVSPQERPSRDLLRQSLPNRLVAAEHYDEADMVDRTTVRATEARRDPVRAARIQPGPNDKKAQRGFSRYQAAYNEAKARQQGSGIARSPVDHQPVGASSVSISSPHLDSNRLNHGPYHGHTQTHTQSLQNHNTILDEPYHKSQRPPGLLMPADGEIVRPHSERIMHYQDKDEQPRVDSPAFRPGEPRLPPMIRRTPPRRGLQDMLVRSVESPSSDIMMASPRQEGELVFRPVPQPHDTYQRRVADGRISPQRRQVIIVDDSPPQFKRRRMVREDDSGHFRPLPSGETGRHDDIQQSRPSQGLYRSVQPAVARPAMQAPPANGYESQRIFSVPARGIYRDAHPEFTFDRGPLSQRSESFQPVFDNSSDNVSRQSEHRHGSQMQRPLSPRFPAFNQSDSLERNTGSGVPDQTFINHFSQSRLESSQNDEVSIIPLERHRPDYNDQRGYRDEPVRSFAIAHPPRARSPVQYMQRQLQYRAESSYYGENDHRRAGETITYHEQGPSPGAFPSPSYATSLEPRRQVVVID